MKVKELIEKLTALPQDVDVFVALSDDGECVGTTEIIGIHPCKNWREANIEWVCLERD